MNLRVLGIVVFCMIATSANGSLLGIDWQTAGDKALTQDTTTGLQWLDLSASSNRSFSDVSTQLGVGGDFEGFRYASEVEVRTLFSNAGVPDLSGAWNLLNYQPVLDLQSLIGITRGSFGESFGATGDQGFNSSSVLGIGLQQQSNPSSSVYQQARVLVNNTIPLDQTAFLGHWLVRPVPVPSAVWLFGSGLLGLVGIARRKVA